MFHARCVKITAYIFVKFSSARRSLGGGGGRGGGQGSTIISAAGSSVCVDPHIEGYRGDTLFNRVDL